MPAKPQQPHTMQSMSLHESDGQMDRAVFLAGDVAAQREYEWELSIDRLAELNKITNKWRNDGQKHN